MKIATSPGAIQPTKASYALLPRHLLSAPPILHSYEEDAHKLTPFQCAILIACLRLARSTLTQQRHAEAIKAGKKAIEQELREAEIFKQEWRATKQARRRGQPAPAPQRSHTFRSKLTHKPMQLSKALRSAGEYAYQQKLKQLRREKADAVLITVSKSALLREVKLAADGNNLRRIGAALNRIRHLGPIVQWEKQPDGRLQLQVAGDWLAPPFARVPVPLPLKSSIALALYLFLHNIDCSAANKATIAFPKLCDILGIRRRFANRTVNRALQIINDHLEKLPWQDYREVGIKVPGRYAIDGEGDRIRFVASHHQHRAPEEEEWTEPPTPIRRVQLTKKAEQRLQLQKAQRVYQREIARRWVLGTLGSSK